MSENNLSSRLWKMSDREIEILLAVYSQANEYDRHYDTMAWNMGAIMMTVSLGIFTVAVTIFERVTIHLLMLLGAASLVVLILWLLMFRRMGRFQTVRTRQRIQEVAKLLNRQREEVDLGRLMEIHPFPERLRWRLGIKRLNLVMFIVIFSVWILLIILKYVTILMN